MSKPTAGSWHVVPGMIYFVKDQAGFNVIATVQPHHELDDDTQRANAALIAAAPELLEALTDALRLIDDNADVLFELIGHYPHCECLQCRCRAAIRKATESNRYTMTYDSGLVCGADGPLDKLRVDRHIIKIEPR